MLFLLNKSVNLSTKFLYRFETNITPLPIVLTMSTISSILFKSIYTSSTFLRYSKTAPASKPRSSFSKRAFIPFDLPVAEATTSCVVTFDNLSLRDASSSSISFRISSTYSNPFEIFATSIFCLIFTNCNPISIISSSNPSK